MSTIITVMRIPDGINSCEEFPSDFKMTALGTRDDVLQLLEKAFGDVEVRDDSFWWIHFDGTVCDVYVPEENPDPEYRSVFTMHRLR